MIMRRLIAATALLAGFAPAALAGGPATQWSVGHKSKARLIVGSMPGASGGALIYAGVEIALEKNWKTYWRHPGDAGGVPPYFDWSKSRNLKKAKVSFPAPYRFVEQLGDSIGYKSRLVLPIHVEPQVAGRKIGLAVDLQYGVCREICIPAQAKLALEFDPAQLRAMPPQLAQALDSVPLDGRQRTAKSPHPMRVDAKLGGDKPKLVFDVAFPDGVSNADLFVEAGSDLYLPMPRKAKSLGANEIRYEIDLSKNVDVKALKGRTLRLTMVSARQNAEAVHKLP